MGLTSHCPLHLGRALAGSKNDSKNKTKENKETNENEEERKQDQQEGDQQAKPRSSTGEGTGQRTQGAPSYLLGETTLTSATLPREDGSVLDWWV